MTPTSQVQMWPQFQFSSFCSPQDVYERHLHIDNNWSFITDGMMMTTSQHTETSGMMTQITKEVVQRSVMGGTTVTKKMFYES